MTRGWIARVLALGCILSTGIALAQPKRAPAAPSDARVARAEAAFRRAGLAFDAGNLENALANYQESYALWPRPRTLLNLGVVLRKLGRVAEAANLLAEYIESEGADASRVDAVRETLEAMDQEIGRLEITTERKGEVMVDDRVLNRGELARAVRVAPGRHRVTQGQEVVELSLSKGEVREIELGREGREGAPAPTRTVAPAPASAVEGTPDEAPTRAPPARARPSRPTRFYLWTAGATVISGGVTAYLALRLRDQQDQLDAILAAPQAHEYGEAISVRDRGRRTALFTNVGIGVTAAGAVATAVLFFLRDRDETLTPSVSATGRGDVSLSLGGAW